MTTDFEPVTAALAAGADPAMLCATCPWDRNCVTPPTMTRAEIGQKMADAAREDRARMETARAAGTPAGLPVNVLVTALAVGTRDISADVCPVFALRLRSGGGRKIADALKTAMQGWDDQA